MKKTITKEFQFDSAHRLYDDDLSEEENERIFGKCTNLHGHTYKLFVTISGEERYGMIINFTNLKHIVNQNVIDIFDHKYLNEVPEMRGKLTTCENQIKVIWHLLVNELYSQGVILEEIKLYETPTSYCTLSKPHYYMGADLANENQ